MSKRIKRSLELFNVYHPDAPTEIITIESSAEIYGKLEKALLKAMYQEFGMQVKAWK